MSRRIAMVALAFLLLGGLAACGRKGALEPPPQSVFDAPQKVAVS